MDVVMNTQVITPHALPMFREPRARSTHKQAEKARQDPKKSHRPDLPQGKSGEWRVGMIAAAVALAGGVGVMLCSPSV